MTPLGIAGPLAGTRVLDLSRFPPGAYCTVLLADLGAEVIRIEPPTDAARRSGGAGQVGLSRGKRSVALDLRLDGAGAVLRRLAATADVLVENARPGAMDARGFGPSQAAVEVPSLVWCSITGFGQEGPYAERSGHDLTYLAHSGLLSALAPQLPWHPQTMLSVPLGALMAAIGIMAALVERAGTGKGSHIDISLADAATWLLSGDDSQLTERPFRLGDSPGRRLYECADGEFISVAAAEPRTWAALCDALGHGDLVEQVYPAGDAAVAVAAALARTFATRPAREWVDRLGPLGTAVGAVNRGRQVADDPHNRARGTTVEVAGVAVPANPIRLRDASGARTSTATAEPPLVGADTDAVLLDVGFSGEEIEALRASRVIG